MDAQALKRIAYRLFAMADLAERASLLPHPVLCLVLWLLRPAERIVRDFVADQLPWAALDTPAVPHADPDARTEALRLAASLRMLAAAICGLSLLERDISPTAVLRDTPRLPAVHLRGPAYADTS